MNQQCRHKAAASAAENAQTQLCIEARNAFLRQRRARRKRNAVMRPDKICSTRVRREQVVGCVHRSRYAGALSSTAVALAAPYLTRIASQILKRPCIMANCPQCSAGLSRSYVAYRTYTLGKQGDTAR
jgi:hypothetical protein